MHGQECKGPNLSFDLGGFSLSFEAKDYAGVNCAPDLGLLNLDEPKFVGIYAFGETLLRRYYAAFDWEHRKLGFAPLVRKMGSAVIRTSHVLPDAMAGTLMVRGCEALKDVLSASPGAGSDKDRHLAPNRH